MHKCLVGYSTPSSFLALEVINKNTYFQFGINGGKTPDNLAEFAQTALFQNLCTYIYTRQGQYWEILRTTIWSHEMALKWDVVIPSFMFLKIKHSRN